MTHEEAYPMQYAHPLVGKEVEVRLVGGQVHRFRVHTVVTSPFGRLATDGAGKAWLVSKCQERGAQ